MRWLILALSLGTTLATLWRGIMLLFTNMGTAGVASSSPFWRAVILCVASLLGFIGGILAFNYKMASLIFLVAATITTFFGYGGNNALTYSFGFITIISTIYLYMYRRAMYDMYGYPDETYNNDDDDEDDDDDEEDDDDEPTTRIMYKMPKRRSAYSMQQMSDSLTIKPQQKQRKTKICLSCGVDVPIEYKYCPICGVELYTYQEGEVSEDISIAEAEYAEEKKDESIIILGSDTEAKKNGAKHIYKINAINEDEEIDRKENGITGMNTNPINESSEKVEVVPVVRKIPLNEPSGMKENDEIPFKPLRVQQKKQRNLDGDSSYQSFGRYTQSRKKRKVSIFKRSLLALVVVSLVGTVAFYIYKGISIVDGPQQIEVPIQRIPGIIDDVNERDIILDNPLPIEVPDITPKLPFMEVVPARQIVTTGSGVNLRENHTTTSRSVTRVQANNTYTVLEQWQASDAASLPAADKALTGIWYKIQFNNSTAGWIYGQYAFPIDGRAASLPAGYTDALLNSFGENAEKIEQKLGKPTRQQTRGEAVVYEYANLNITLRQGKVQSIQISGSGHNLLNGLAAGMTFDETSKIIGAPNRYRDGVLSYLEAPNRGIIIRRGTDGRIRSITVGAV